MATKSFQFGYSSDHLWEDHLMGGMLYGESRMIWADCYLAQSLYLLCKHNKTLMTSSNGI